MATTRRVSRPKWKFGRGTKVGTGAERALEALGYVRVATIRDDEMRTFIRAWEAVSELHNLIYRRNERQQATTPRLRLLIGGAS